MFEERFKDIRENNNEKDKGIGSCPKCGSITEVPDNKFSRDAYNFSVNDVKTMMICSNCGAMLKKVSLYQDYEGILAMGS